MIRPSRSEDDDGNHNDFDLPVRDNGQQAGTPVLSIYVCMYACMYV
jgi:hypothetical protein